MKYFQTLPQILQPDFNGNYVTVTNLISRAYLLSSLQKNVFLYYDYTVKDYDKPEIISYKLYDNQYRYWMVLYANNIFDVNSDWPLDYRNFMLYINDKYKTEANTAHLDPMSYTMDTIHHYEQTITTYGNLDNVKSSITIQIDANTYTNTIESTNTYTLDGVLISRTVSKKPVSIYDYELQENEKKRNVKLIKDSYADSMEKQLFSLMG